jgi:hypothetical protein
LKAEPPAAFVRPNTTALFGALALVAVLGGGCGNGRIVLPMTMDSRAVAIPEARSLTTHEAAVRGIAAVFIRELGLPVPDRLTVYVYPSRAVFEYGLIHDGHLSSSRAAELAEFAIGVGKRRQLLFNDDTYTQHGREWLRLVAHELAHLAQFELAQGEGRGEQWLAEGMAEWTAFTVLERLGLDTVARRREIARTSIRNHGALMAARLDLEVLGTPRGFIVRHLREGSRPTYQLAFLMSDYLIQREGLPGVIQYFRSFAESPNRRQNFARAFGQPLDRFEREVQEYLRSLVR